MASAVGRCLAKAHRSTRNDHVHRNAQLGSRRSEPITFGIIPKLSKRDLEGDSRIGVCLIQGGERRRFAMAIPLRADFDARMVRAAAR